MRRRNYKAFVVWVLLFVGWSNHALGALSDPVTADILVIPGAFMVPVSVRSNWQTANSTPTTADNAGSKVLVASGLSRAAIIPINVTGRATTLKIRMRYATSGSTTTSPTIQVFSKDANGVYESLCDGNGSYDIALTAAPTTDVQDASWAYTVTQTLDIKGNSQILVAVQIAASGTAFTNAIVQVSFY